MAAACMRRGASTLARSSRPRPAVGIYDSISDLSKHYWPAQWPEYAQTAACPTVLHNHHTSLSNPLTSARSGLTTRATATAAQAGPVPQQGGETYKLRVALEDMPKGKTKLRLDAYLAAQLASGHMASRAKVHASIKAGLATVNGQVCDKPSHALARGDHVVCTLMPGPSLEALPEAIPLDIVYEDEHLMVINKPAGMAVHISAGHHTGTLVNALLAHCGLPGVRIDPSYPSNPPASTDQQQQPGPGFDQPLSLEALGVLGSGQQGLGPVAGTGGGLPQEWIVQDGSGDTSDGDDDEFEGGDDASGSLPGVKLSNGAAGGSHAAVTAAGTDEQWNGHGNGRLLNATGAGGVLRPGIVHRLDIGTSGLLVVAKREVAQRALSAQFKARTVGRIYHSLTVGCPSVPSGRVMTNIDRDPGDRKRMAALPYGGSRGRTSASNYQVLEQLGSTAALVQWKLDTGRTHQIRVHAKHLGHPLLADGTYGGAPATAAMAMSKGRPSLQPRLKAALETFNRPALHARSLAFDHPVTGQRLAFECDLPPDMQRLLALLRDL